MNRNNIEEYLWKNTKRQWHYQLFKMQTYTIEERCVHLFDWQIVHEIVPVHHELWFRVTSFIYIFSNPNIVTELFGFPTLSTLWTKLECKPYIEFHAYRITKSSRIVRLYICFCFSIHGIVTFNIPVMWRMDDKRKIYLNVCYLMFFISREYHGEKFYLRSRFRRVSFASSFDYYHRLHRSQSFNGLTTKIYNFA